MRKYKYYQIVAEADLQHPYYGTCFFIQGLSDPDTKEVFRPSELPIWDGTRHPGYIRPVKVSDPYWADCGAHGKVRVIDVSALECYPNGREPYIILVGLMRQVKSHKAMSLWREIGVVKFIYRVQFVL